MFLTIILILSISIIVFSNFCFRIVIKDICFNIDLIKKASYELELGNVNTAIYYATRAGVSHLEIMEIVDNAIYEKIK